MNSIELNFQQSDSDREQVTTALMQAVSGAIDPDRHETTYLTVDGEPVAVILPVQAPAAQRPDQAPQAPVQYVQVTMPRPAGC